MHSAEEATIRAFAAPARRERMLAMLGNPKRRRSACDALNHSGWYDPRFARSLPSSADVVAALVAAGAAGVCRLISDCPASDGRDLPVAEAVAAAEACGSASILCCAGGRVAAFIDEVGAPRTRVLLVRQAG